MLTGIVGVGLGGVDAAFAALGNPEFHAKILIDPQREGTSTISPADGVSFAD